MRTQMVRRMTGFMVLLVFTLGSARQMRPSLFLTQQEATLIRENLGKYPAFDRAFNEARQRLDRAIASPMDVPIPKDVGGYTHERHSQNRTEMQLAGVLYAVTKDERYAVFIRDMLLKYSELYPKIGKHPGAAGESYGRLFWQTLNETVWLVHVAQAYDCVYDWLLPRDRETVENNVLRPMAKFFIEEHAAEHDRIHNHGTWTVAAVGMAGLALRDDDLVDKALYGTKKDKKGGFIRQMDLLFSPDGYYTEGPYYARYALMPFFYFAQALQNSRPELKIFEYRNGLLNKALYSALQLTAPTGEFFPVNDAMKGMNFKAPEMVLALDIAYQRYGEDRFLLHLAQRQNTIILNGSGLAVAKAIAAGQSPASYPFRSIEFTDGPNGDQGGIGILRSGDPKDQTVLVMKYTAHGLSHGHFDKLSMSYYDQSREVIQDYGSVRFINVEPKDGGRYLPENKSFALQTIAHNTVTVDGQSQYQGKVSISESRHANRHFFSSTDPSFQVMSAKVDDAYEGVKLQRTMAMVADPTFIRPVVIDIVRMVSSSQHQYDLPLYYLGQFISTNVKYTPRDKERKLLGTSNGYQHLWNEAEGNVVGSIRFSWLTGNRYYTTIVSADTSTRVFFARIGGSDPRFNLRNEPAMIMRQQGYNHVFASVLEPHGEFDESREYSRNASGIVNSVSVLASTDEGTVVEIMGKNDLKWIFMVSNRPDAPSASHTISAFGRTYRWTGNASIKKNQE